MSKVYRDCPPCRPRPNLKGKAKPKGKPRRGGYDSSDCSCSDCDSYTGSDSCSCSDCEPSYRSRKKTSGKEKGGKCCSCSICEPRTKPRKKATTTKRNPTVPKKTSKATKN